MKTKQELKEEYKQKKTQMGVFQIRNIITNKIFVESSIDLIAIWNRQRMQLNFGSHHNPELQNDWNELGEDKFKYEILSQLEPKEAEHIDYKKEVKLLEEMFIDELKPFGAKGYNRRKIS